MGIVMEVCSPGVMVPVVGLTVLDAMHDKNVKCRWCYDQGWTNDDFLVSANVWNPKWYFKDIKHQTWFILRWA